MTAKKDRIDALGATLLISFSALLGLNQALVKLVNAGFAPVFQGGLRSACALVLIVAYVVIRRQRLDWRNTSWFWGITTGLFFAGEFALLFLALDYTTVARVSLFFYTMPFFVAVGSHFLFPGERLTWIRSAGLALAILGVALGLFSDGSTSDHATSQSKWIGDALALVAALFWAGITLATRGTKLSNSPPEQILIFQLGISAVVLLAMAPFFGDTVREVTPFILGIFAFQVIFIASFGFLMWIWILSIYPVSNMASFSLLSPLFGVFFGWLIFNDAITPVFLLALGFVASGLLLINRKPTT